jgi:sporulation integral membrane protein YtvI
VKVFKTIKNLYDSAKSKLDELNQEAESKPTKSPETKKVSVETTSFSYQKFTKSVLIIIGLIGLAWVLITIKEIIFLFFVAFLFAAALDPIVDKLEKYKIPRGLSTLGIFLIFLSIVIVFIGSLIPIIRTESVNIAEGLKNLTEQIISGQLKLPTYLQFINDNLSNAFGNVDAETVVEGFSQKISENTGSFATFSGEVVTTTFKTIGVLFGFVLSTIFVLLLTYFFTVDERSVDKFIHSMFPSRYGSYITKKTEAVKSKIGQWLRGQLILMLAVFLSVYIGLLIIGVDYAFTLALFAGLTELIPVIGPWLGLIPAIPVAANISGTAVLWVLILYFVIQQLENNIFVPIIMNKATGLNPIVVLFAMAVGFELAGIIGIIVSIPTTASIAIFLEDYLNKSDK